MESLAAARDTNRAAGRLCDRVPAPPHPPSSLAAPSTHQLAASLLDSGCRRWTRAAAIPSAAGLAANLLDSIAGAPVARPLAAARLARSIAAARIARFFATARFARTIAAARLAVARIISPSPEKPRRRDRGVSSAGRRRVAETIPPRTEAGFADAWVPLEKNYSTYLSKPGLQRGEHNLTAMSPWSNYCSKRCRM